MLFLIGMSRAGKTETGKALAAKNRTDFFDTDAELEKKYGFDIAHIYKTLGKKEFRTAELEILRTIVLNCINPNCIISTGGGIVENAEAVCFLKQFDDIILIDTPPDIILNRIKTEAETGKGYPQFLGKDLNYDQAKKAFYKIYNRRMKIYKELATSCLKIF